MLSQAFSYIFFFSFHLYIIYAHLPESNAKNSPPLKFLNQLNGIQKGNHHKGVNELKKHLSYLGYMNCPSSFADHENANTFDDCLELALKKYQEFYGLSITGALDANTIKKMLQPRCGMPDFHNHNRNTASFHEHFSFHSGRPKWNKKRLRYAFNKFMREETIPPIESAVRQWASVTPFQFIRVTNFTDDGADIRISFMRGYHGDQKPFPDSGIAHAFPPPDARIHFNKDVNWNVYDLQTVALHELGHALGLGHSRIKEAVMYAPIEAEERKGLHQDDIEGIKALYK